MSTLAVALKDEIRRLARKEVKSHTGTIARSVAQHRREIAALKRQLREQSKKIAALTKDIHQSTGKLSSPDVLDGNLRFSARSAKAQRRRTGLSAADYARLVGVSPLTIYNWENGKSRPRKEQFSALVALRGLGKRAVQTKLDALTSKKSTSPLKLHRRRRAS